MPGADRRAAHALRLSDRMAAVRGRAESLGAPGRPRPRALLCRTYGRGARALCGSSLVTARPSRVCLPRICVPTISRSGTWPRSGGSISTSTVPIPRFRKALGGACSPGCPPGRNPRLPSLPRRPLGGPCHPPRSNLPRRLTTDRRPELWNAAAVRFPKTPNTFSATCRSGTCESIWTPKLGMRDWRPETARPKD